MTLWKQIWHFNIQKQSGTKVCQQTVTEPVIMVTDHMEYDIFLAQRHGGDFW